MTDKKPFNSSKDLSSLGSGAPTLQLLKDKSDSLRPFQKQIEGVFRLKNKQIPNFHIAELSEYVLTIHTSNASVSAQLRMMEKELVESINKTAKTGIIVNKIKVLVKPSHAKKLGKQEKLRKLSPSNSELLASTANSIEDKKLREALARIARHKNND